MIHHMRALEVERRLRCKCSNKAQLQRLRAIATMGYDCNNKTRLQE